MVMVTSHAQEEIARLAPFVGRARIHSLVRRARQLPNDGSFAVCCPMHKVTDPERDQRRPSDVAAAIVRRGKLITVMLTRREQVNRAHLRVDNIL